ncbi:DUF4097 family beta strand repeat-containing protein [Paenibacillus antarcticus]|uniref:Adhesin domain-containing protein n=1 Tax=Paenibacillus antarcticus TaxID=253703 RepID=A0A168NDF0_9BACL|nr:DUF4097 family beta strand repeat-containing protein [Paenibacillus antarcticus]OAB45675.1 hypothetical protein PBAT_12230 [Paenibacillus antarcticus]
MRRNYKPMLLAGFVSLVLLSGCAKNANEVIQTSIDEATQAIGAIGETVSSTASEWGDQLKRTGIHKEIVLSQNIESSVSILHLANEVGSIEVKGSSEDKIKVKATIWSLDKSLRDDKYQDMMDSAEITAVVSGDQLKISTHSKGNEKLDLWKWAEKEYGFSNFSIDYVVEIPNSVNGFEISSEVGAINLSHLKGSYNVHNEVGAISIEGAHIQGKSNVGSETGSIKLAIDQMEADSRLEAKTEVGSIHANLAESLQVSLETESEIGSITGAPKGASDINGGGPLLSLSTSVGSITIE